MLNHRRDDNFRIRDLSDNETGYRAFCQLCGTHDPRESDAESKSVVGIHITCGKGAGKVEMDCIFVSANFILDECACELYRDIKEASADRLGQHMHATNRCTNIERFDEEQSSKEDLWIAFLENVTLGTSERETEISIERIFNYLMDTYGPNMVGVDFNALLFFAEAVGKRFGDTEIAIYGEPGDIPFGIIELNGPVKLADVECCYNHPEDIPERPAERFIQEVARGMRYT